MIKIACVGNIKNHLLSVIENYPEFEVFGALYISDHYEEKMEAIKQFKPDVIHFIWCERGNKDLIFKTITELKKLGVPLVLEMDWNDLHPLGGDDIAFVNSGNLFLMETVLARDYYPHQPLIKVPTYCIGALEWGPDEFLFSQTHIPFKDFYDKVAGNTIHVEGGHWNREKNTGEPYDMKITKKEDRKRYWGTVWHVRPELRMNDKFEMMRKLGMNYRCRWFNGWSANSLTQMHSMLRNEKIPEGVCEPYIFEFSEYWEHLSDCMCGVDNYYWGMSRLGHECAALKMPMVSTRYVSSGSLYHPKLVCEDNDVKAQVELVKWLIDNPAEAIKLGEEAYQNICRDCSLESMKIKVFEMLKMVGIQ